MFWMKHQSILPIKIMLKINVIIHIKIKLNCLLNHPSEKITNSNQTYVQTQLIELQVYLHLQKRKNKLKNTNSPRNSISLTDSLDSNRNLSPQSRYEIQRKNVQVYQIIDSNIDVHLAELKVDCLVH